MSPSFQEMASKEKSWRGRGEEQEARMRALTRDLEQRAEQGAADMEASRQTHLQELHTVR
jgi:hypothetical protein